MVDLLRCCMDGRIDGMVDGMNGRMRKRESHQTRRRAAGKKDSDGASRQWQLTTLG